MSDRRINEVPKVDIRDAIEIIATAERVRSKELDQATGPGGRAEPDGLPLVQSYNAPQGLDAVVDRAIGTVELPSLIDLKEAVDRVRGGFVAAPDLSPEMTATVLAVMDEELLKIERYLELRDQ